MTQKNVHNIILREKKSGHKTQVPILFFKRSMSVYVCRAYVFRKKEI